MTLNKMETTECNLCGSNEYHSYWEQNDRRYVLNQNNTFCLVKCCDCGLIYLSPRPKKEHIKTFYPQNFYDPRKKSETHRSLLKTIASYAMLDRIVNSRALKEKINIVLKQHPKPGRLLDVGCAAGEFLHEMHTLGWSVTGIDISKDMCHYVRSKYGIDVLNKDVENINFPKDSFDCITFWASLEHIYDPMETLHNTNNILKDGGIVIILVPNAESFEEKLFKRIDPNPIDIPRHLYHFSRKTLCRMLVENGFTLRKVIHFTFNASDRTTVILDKFVRKYIKIKLLRAVAENISLLTGYFMSRIFALFGRSHSMIIIAEKETNLTHLE